MNRLKNIFRLISVLATVLIVGAAPYLQAVQSSSLSEDWVHSCCCGCSHNEAELPTNSSTELEGSCCCSVSAPVTETEAPLEPQLPDSFNSDSFTPVMSETWQVRVVEIAPYQDVQVSEQSAHGPPLYALNGSYLI